MEGEPVSYRSVRVYKALPERVISWVRNAGNNNAQREIARFDVTIATPDGQVCVEITDFSIRRMESSAGFAVIDTGAAEAEQIPHPEAPRPLSPAEERLRHTLSQGIRAEEGGDLFLRALALGAPPLSLQLLHCLSSYLYVKFSQSYLLLLSPAIHRSIIRFFFSIYYFFTFFFL